MLVQEGGVDERQARAIRVLAAKAAQKLKTEIKRLSKSIPAESVATPTITVAEIELPTHRQVGLAFEGGAATTMLKLNKTHYDKLMQRYELKTESTQKGKDLAALSRFHKALFNVVQRYAPTRSFYFGKFEGH